MEQYLTQDMQTIRQTMLQQEQTFKEQVHELHRVYRVQRMLIAEMGRKNNEVYSNGGSIFPLVNLEDATLGTKNLLGPMHFPPSNSTPFVETDNAVCRTFDLEQPLDAGGCIDTELNQLHNGNVKDNLQDEPDSPCLSLNLAWGKAKESRDIELSSPISHQTGVLIRNVDVKELERSPSILKVTGSNGTKGLQSFNLEKEPEPEPEDDDTKFSQISCSNKIEETLHGGASNTHWFLEASVSAKAEQDARCQAASSQVQRKYGNDVIENGRHPSICIYQNGDHELRRPSLQWTQQQQPPGADPKGPPVKLSGSSPAPPFYGFYNGYVGYNEHISKNNSQYFWQGNNVRYLEGHHTTVDIPSTELQSKNYSITNNGISNSKIDAGLWYGYVPVHQTSQQLHRVATLQVGALPHQIQVHASNMALQNSFFSNSKSSYDPSMEYTVDGSQVSHNQTPGLFWGQGKFSTFLDCQGTKPDHKKVVKTSVAGAGLELNSVPNELPQLETVKEFQIEDHFEMHKSTLQIKDENHKQEDNKAENRIAGALFCDKVSESDQATLASSNEVMEPTKEQNNGETVLSDTMESCVVPSLRPDSAEFAASLLLGLCASEDATPENDILAGREKTPPVLKKSVAWFANAIPMETDSTKCTGIGTSNSESSAQSAERPLEKRVESLSQLDPFEYVTLQLKQIDLSHEISNSVIAPRANDEDTATPEKTASGRSCRRPKRQKNFQAETLPSIRSLSRQEIKEDLQLMGGLMRSTRETKFGMFVGPEESTGRRSARQCNIARADRVASAQQNGSGCEGISRENSTDALVWLGTWGDSIRRKRKQRQRNKQPKLFSL